MDKKNILFWPRAAGIGDTFGVLGAGFVHFKGQPFELVVGYHTKSLIDMSGEYKDFYKTICDCFKLCVGYSVLGTKADVDEMSEEIIEKFKKYATDKYNVFAIPDSHLARHGFLECFEHRNEILTNFKNSFSPSARPEVAEALETSKTKICFHLRSLKIQNKEHKNGTNVLRNVDLEKWVEFIFWIASNYDVELYAIGESNKESPFYIDEDLVQRLSTLPNVKLFPWTHSTNLEEDLYIVKESDIFIGSHSGTLAPAWMTGSFLLCYDYGTKEHYTTKPWGYKNPMIFRDSIQKVYWLKQSLRDMKEYFKKFMNETYEPLKKCSIEKKIDLQKNSFAEDIQKAALLIDKYGLYNELYYYLAVGCVKNREYQKANEYFEKSNDYLAENGHDLYHVSMLYYKAKKYKDARVFLERFKVWCEYGNSSENLFKCLFMLGKVCVKQRRHRDGIANFKKCLKISPNNLVAMNEISLVCEEIGLHDQALVLLERISLHDAGYEDVGLRLESCKQKVSPKGVDVE